MSAHGLLTGKTVLVTGGANGIGRAVAAMSAQQGARVVIVADLVPGPRDGQSVEDLVREAGSAFVFCAANVTDASALDRAVAQADAFGGLDVMVCNAGMGLPNDSLDIDEDSYERLIDVNLKGVFRSARAAARPMIAHGTGGSIIITASIGGLRGSAKTLTYSATKGAARLSPPLGIPMPSPDQVIQPAYTVADIEQSIIAYGERLNTGPWFVMGPFNPPSARYRDAPCGFVISLAFAYAGPLQIELLQQHDDSPSALRERPLGFHHWGIATQDFDVLLEICLESVLRQTRQQHLADRGAIRLLLLGLAREHVRSGRRFLDRLVHCLRARPTVPQGRNDTQYQG